MPDIILSFSQEEIDMAEKCVPDFSQWLKNAARGKINAVGHMLVKEHTPYNPEKLDNAARLALIAPLNLKSRKQKDAEAREKMRAGSALKIVQPT